MLALRSLTRRYDLVHVHNMPDILVFAALVPKVFGAKVVLDLHDPDAGADDDDLRTDAGELRCSPLEEV